MWVKPTNVCMSIDRFKIMRVSWGRINKVFNCIWTQSYKPSESSMSEVRLNRKSKRRNRGKTYFGRERESQKEGKTIERESSCLNKCDSTWLENTNVFVVVQSGGCGQQVCNLNGNLFVASLFFSPSSFLSDSAFSHFPHSKTAEWSVSSLSHWYQWGAVWVPQIILAHGQSQKVSGTRENREGKVKGRIEKGMWKENREGKVKGESRREGERDPDCGTTYNEEEGVGNEKASNGNECAFKWGVWAREASLTFIIDFPERSLFR